MMQGEWMMDKIGLGGVSLSQSEYTLEQSQQMTRQGMGWLSYKARGIFGVFQVYFLFCLNNCTALSNIFLYRAISP